LVSASILFERGSDLSPLALQGDCNCRVYHVLLHANKGDWFDDVNKLIKPLHPTTFDVSSPPEFRKALADIVNQLQREAQ
jgi:hypothetical protein